MGRTERAPRSASRARRSAAAPGSAAARSSARDRDRRGGVRRRRRGRDEGRPGEGGRGREPGAADQVRAGRTNCSKSCSPYRMRPGRSGRACALSFSSARASALMSASVRCCEKCRSIPSRWCRRASAIVSVHFAVGTTRIERRSAVRGWTRSTSPAFSIPIDDAGEAALAVEGAQQARSCGCPRAIPRGGRGRRTSACGIADRLLELRVEHVGERKRALEVEAPAAKALGRGT